MRLLGLASAEVSVVPRNEDGHHGEDDECSHSGPARQLALSLYLYLPETKLLVSLPARALLLLARKPQVLRMFAAGVIELALDLREREALTHAMRYKFCRPLLTPQRSIGLRSALHVAAWARSESYSSNARRSSGVYWRAEIRTLPMNVAQIRGHLGGRCVETSLWLLL